MQFNMNEKKQAQCPECGKWIDMIHNDKTLLHEISCNGRTWVIFIDKERLEKFVEECKTIKNEDKSKK